MSEAQERLATIDFVRLGRWLQAQGLAEGEVEAPTLLAGGTQNLIVRFVCGGSLFVLRKAGGARRTPMAAKPCAEKPGFWRRWPAPMFPTPASSQPAVTMRCWAARFYLMEPVEGFNVGVGMPEPHASQPAMRRAMGFALIDGLARAAACGPRERGVWPIWATLTAFWSARSAAGATSWRAMRATPAGRARAGCHRWRRSGAGWSNTCRQASRPASFTVITTSRTCCSARTVRRWPPSSTGS
jgi:hypothetical protein